MKNVLTCRVSAKGQRNARIICYSSSSGSLADRHISQAPEYAIVNSAQSFIDVAYEKLVELADVFFSIDEVVITETLKVLWKYATYHPLSTDDGEESFMLILGSCLAIALQTLKKATQSAFTCQ